MKATRHIQKMVRDIKNNEGGFMDKFKKITNKAPPNLPRRDYVQPDNSGAGGEWSDDDEFDESDYEDPNGQSDSETYEAPNECDDNYETPPTEAEKKAISPAFSFGKGEYADKQGGHSKQQPFAKPTPGRPSNPLPKMSPALPKLPDQPSRLNPPLPTPRNSLPLKPKFLSRKEQQEQQVENGNSEEEDENYIVPVDEEEDNYIQPTEDSPPPSKPPAVNRFMKPTSAGSSSAQVTNSSPVHYEVCEQEAKPFPPQSRNNVWKSPAQQKVETTELPMEDEYEICDPDDPDSGGSHIFKPTPSPAPVSRIGMKMPPMPKPPKKQLLARDIIQPKEDKPTPVERWKGSNSSQELPFHTQIQAINLKPPLPKPAPHPKPPEPASRNPNTLPRTNASAGSMTAEQDSGVYSKEWYASTCGRRAAEEALQKSNKDGAFLIRKSTGQNLEQPYTLVVLFNRRVYNIPIRYIETTQQYALGREKSGEERFGSVAEMVQNHQRNPLVLIDSQNNTKDSTKLKHPVRVS